MPLLCGAVNDVVEHPLPFYHLDATAFRSYVPPPLSRRIFLDPVSLDDDEAKSPIKGQEAPVAMWPHRNDRGERAFRAYACARA